MKFHHWFHTKGKYSRADRTPTNTVLDFRGFRVTIIKKDTAIYSKWNLFLKMAFYLRRFVISPSMIPVMGFHSEASKNSKNIL